MSLTGLVWFAALTTAGSAQAFAPDVTLGAGAQYRAPQEVRGSVVGEMEILDYLGMRLEASLGAQHDALVSVIWAGPTLSLDIATWAPALFVGLGWRSTPSALTGTVRAELRRYVSMHTAIGVGLGAEWAQRDSTQLAATLGYFFRF